MLFSTQTNYLAEVCQLFPYRESYSVRVHVSHDRNWDSPFVFQIHNFTNSEIRFCAFSLVVIANYSFIVRHFQCSIQEDILLKSLFLNKRKFSTFDFRYFLFILLNEVA